ncbi:MAG: HU family DNA-binding protein [Prevotella sp.]|nr:HU family DNA-binding protein [Prevotella sp.]
MPVLFKLFQDNRANSATKGKFYARALVTGVKDLNALSKEIAHSTTVTEADCLAVLKELSNVMVSKLQDGYRIDLPDIGSFKIGLRTKPADTATEFNIAKNVSGYRLNFVPAFSIQGSGKGSKRIYRAFEGIQIGQSPFNNVSKTPATEPSENAGA